MKRVMIYGDDQNGAIKLYTELLKHTNRLVLGLMSGANCQDFVDWFEEDDGFCKIKVTFQTENLIVDPPRFLEINLHDRNDDYDELVKEVLAIVDYKSWSQWGSDSIIFVRDEKEFHLRLTNILIEEGWNPVVLHTSRKRRENELECDTRMFRSRESMEADDSLKFKWEDDGHLYGISEDYIVDPFVMYANRTLAEKIKEWFEHVLIIEVQFDCESEGDTFGCDTTCNEEDLRGKLMQYLKRNDATLD
jgi:hypothetical protein